jgi:hypothetical protein
MTKVDIGAKFDSCVRYACITLAYYDFSLNHHLSEQSTFSMRLSNGYIVGMHLCVIGR